MRWSTGKSKNCSTIRSWRSWPSNGGIIASLRSRNGEALRVAEKLQGGGHANASGATLPRSVKTIPDAVAYLRQVLNPKKDAPLNSLEGLFDELEAAKK